MCWQTGAREVTRPLLGGGGSEGWQAVDGGCWSVVGRAPGDAGAAGAAAAGAAPPWCGRRRWPIRSRRTADRTMSPQVRNSSPPAASVLLQVVLPLEGLAAGLAGEGDVVLVRALVDHQVVRLGEAALAVLAHELALGAHLASELSPLVRLNGHYGEHCRGRVSERVRSLFGHLRSPCRRVPERGEDVRRRSARIAAVDRAGDAGGDLKRAVFGQARDSAIARKQRLHHTAR